MTQYDPEPLIPGVSPMRRGTFIVGLLALTAFAATLRLFRLAEPSFWVDELYLVLHIAREPGIDYWLRPLAYLPTTFGLWLQQVDIGALSPTAVHEWRALGITEWSLRLPSAIIGVLSVLVLGYMSQRLVDRRTALLFTALLAVATWHLWVSQTARFYAQQILIYNVCLILYYDGVTRRSPRTLVTCGVFFVLAFMTQMTSPMLLGVFAVESAIRRWRNRTGRPGLAGGLLIAAALFVCGGIVWWWYIISDFRATGQPAAVLIGGTVWLVGLPVAVCAAGTAVWLWRRDPRLAGFLVASAIVPVAALVVLGWLGAIVHTRYASPAMYGWLMLAAIGLSVAYNLLRPHVGNLLAATPALVVIAACLFSDLVYYTGGYGYRARWREAIAHIDQHRHPDQPIYADFIPHYQLRYYLGTNENIVLIPFDFTRDDLADDDQPYWLLLRNSSPVGNPRAGQHPPGVDLKAHFSHRNFQPYHSVHVYRSRAASPEPTRRADGSGD
ncbi:glycosyltransferase family 39 protein [Phycisphaerales bacterium AB-hyl4]|uniref:Glycosyltransferase family 39 protein n=1 Tax=Natronomicrosphaera hydrolytica TaxID=3242702 RepID=A0ABV4U4U9_9BACT